jgi:hypothetical protein
LSNLAISLAAPSTLLAREGDRQLHQPNLGWDEGGGGREERGGEGQEAREPMRLQNERGATRCSLYTIDQRI